MSIFEDTAPSRYMNAAGIVKRCRESLMRLESDDPLFDSVCALLMLAKVEMEKAASELPF